jgi:steroid Delta-isomerase
MPDKAEVRALLERYCSAMSERRREDWLDCFADDAVQEDPVGAPVNVGREALTRFFDANEVELTLSLTDDPLVVGNEAIGFMKVVADMDGQMMTIPRIVDHRRRRSHQVPACVLRLLGDGPVRGLTVGSDRRGAGGRWPKVDHPPE